VSLNSLRGAVGIAVRVDGGTDGSRVDMRSDGAVRVGSLGRRAVCGDSGSDWASEGGV